MRPGVFNGRARPSNPSERAHNMETTTKRGFLLARGWIQAVILVFLFGFFVLGFLAYRTYTGEPPIPGKVIDPDGRLLFTRANIMAGQGTFLRNGLMEYGSIFGHGAYLGPDYTADYLHRAALMSIDFYNRLGSDHARAATIDDFKTNRYDNGADTLAITEAQANAFNGLQSYYHTFFAEPSTKYGLRSGAITDPTDIRNLTAFFAWSAWCASTLRPGFNYSYTNNWPPEPLVDNHPTADTVVWSVLSLITLLGGIGLLLAAFGRWNFLGWHGRERDKVSFRRPGDVVLAPTQRACAWFFLVMTLLFLLQTLLGGATEHYRAELSNFFGLDLGRLIPFNVARTWHVQLALFWVSTGFLAGGIFLLPMIAGREPPRQHLLAYALLVALAVVVFGSLIGEFITIHGGWRHVWQWFGGQGFEYLNLGRFWQALLTVGLFFWVVIIFRGLRGRLRTEHLANMPWLFFFSALSIPIFYGVGLLASPGSHFTSTDFWRFWVVHLWVEDFLELLFIVGGILPILYLCWLSIRYMVPRTVRITSSC